MRSLFFAFPLRVVGVACPPPTPPWASSLGQLPRSRLRCAAALVGQKYASLACRLTRHNLGSSVSSLFHALLAPLGNRTRRRSTQAPWRLRTGGRATQAPWRLRTGGGGRSARHMDPTVCLAFSFGGRWAVDKWSAQRRHPGFPNFLRIGQDWLRLGQTYRFMFTLQDTDTHARQDFFGIFKCFIGFFWNFLEFL